MLRILLYVLGCYCITPTTLFPQDIRGYGLKLGGVVADQSFEYHDIPFPASLETEKRWGIDAGMFVEFLSTAPVSILGEVHYIQKGYGITYAETTADGPEIVGYVTIYRRIDYLSIPVLLKLRYQTDTFTPYFIGGPRLDVLLGQFEHELDHPIDYNTVDFGISLGVGTEIVLRPAPTALIEFRYSPNITNSYEGTFVDLKNYSFEILLGVVL